MTAYSIEELAGQAEARGVTLAELLSTDLSADEVDRLQGALRDMMDENYMSIEGFMADVEVPSLADLCNLSNDELDEIQREIQSELSDDTLVAGH